MITWFQGKKNLGKYRLVLYSWVTALRLLFHICLIANSSVINPLQARTNSGNESWLNCAHIGLCSSSYCKPQDAMHWQRKTEPMKELDDKVTVSWEIFAHNFKHSYLVKSVSNQSCEYRDHQNPEPLNDFSRAPEWFPSTPSTPSPVRKSFYVLTPSDISQQCQFLDLLRKISWLLYQMTIVDKV